jgi:hypothetical protein
VVFAWATCAPTLRATEAVVAAAIASSPSARGVCTGCNRKLASVPRSRRMVTSRRPSAAVRSPGGTAATTSISELSESSSVSSECSAPLI